MSLRMVEMVVPEAAGGEVDTLAGELDVLGAWQEPLHGQLVLVRLLVAGERTETVLDHLEARFRSREGFRLVLFEVQATLPQPAPEPPVTSTSTEAGPEKDPLRIACAELVAKLSGGAEANRTFLVTVALSTLVAAIGLIRDNVAVIIGAMVIAPLLNPNMTLALATTLGDATLARRALRVNAIGIASALVLAVVIGMLIEVDPTGRQIASRTTVSLSDIALALAAGSAGALAYTTGLSAPLVGVMVAVALLPPLATVGLLLGAGRWPLAAEAGLLTAVNIVCINLAGVGTFLWQRVNPRHWWQVDRATRMVRLAGAIWLGLLAALVALILAAHG